MNNAVDKGRRELQLASGIYCIENIVNNKKYIGSTVNLAHRKRQHFSLLNQGKHFNKHLQSSWNKYGQKNFVYKIVEYCSNEFLEIREDFYIKLFEAQYNKRDSGRRGAMSEGTRLRMKAARKKLKEANSIKYKESEREVAVYDVNGNFIETLSNPKELCRKYKISKAYQYLTGRRRYFNNKYQLFYTEDIFSGKRKILTSYINNVFSKIRVTNVKTGESKDFDSCSDVKKFFKIPPMSFQRHLKSRRLYKKTYEFEYID